MIDKEGIHAVLCPICSVLIKEADRYKSTELLTLAIAFSDAHKKAYRKKK